MQGLPVRPGLVVAVFSTGRHRVLESVPVLRAAGHGCDPGGALCCPGGERPAGSPVRGLLLRRGQYSSTDLGNLTKLKRKSIR